MKINVAEHISTLLYERDRVIIPNLGGFCTTYKSASTEKYGHISPPTKEIYFDEALQFQDDVLIKAIVEQHQISYQEALSEVDNFVQEVKNNIGSNAIVISNIGRLYLDARNEIVLAPSSVNFLEDTFGLPKMNYYPISRNKEKAALLSTAESKRQTDEPAIKKFFLSLWNDQSTIAIIAIVLLLIVILPQLSELAKPNEEERINPMIIEDNQNVVDKNKTLKPFEETTVLDDVEEATIVPREPEKVGKKEETPKVEEQPKKEINNQPENTNEDTNKVKQNENTTPVSSPTTKNYIISVGNFGTQEYADIAIKKVRDAGYKVYTQKNGVSHRVGIRMTCEPSEIDDKMVKVKDKFPSAWLMNRN